LQELAIVHAKTKQIKAREGIPSEENLLGLAMRFYQVSSARLLGPIQGSLSLYDPWAIDWGPICMLTAMIGRNAMTPVRLKVW
jgi:hypothetical protein